VNHKENFESQQRTIRQTGAPKRSQVQLRQATRPPALSTAPSTVNAETQRACLCTHTTRLKCPKDGSSPSTRTRKRLTHNRLVCCNLHYPNNVRIYLNPCQVLLPGNIRLHWRGSPWVPWLAVRKLKGRFPAQSRPPRSLHPTAAAAAAAASAAESGAVYLEPENDQRFAQQEGPRAASLGS
jgi:hypothetical protein